MSGIPFREKIGWYLNLVAGVVQQMPRPDEIDQGAAERWLKDKAGLREALRQTLVPHGKFVELVDFGIFTVPSSIVSPDISISSLRTEGKGEKPYVDSRIEENVRGFNEALQRGKKFRVRAFRCISGTQMYASKCQEFLKRQHAVPVGFQGTLMLWEAMRKKFTPGYKFFSLDEIDFSTALNTPGYNLPSIQRVVMPGGRSEKIYADYREMSDPVDDYSAFLCFTEVPDGES